MNVKTADTDMHSGIFGASVRNAVQAAVGPPTVVLFVSGGELGNDYLRFIENRLREAEDFTGTPIRVVPRLRAPREH